MRVSSVLRILISFAGSVALAFASSACAQNSKPAASTTIRVGLQTIDLAPPSPQFVEPGSDYRVLLEPLSPIANRLVAAYLLPDEFEGLTKNGTQLTRYGLVEVPRRAEFADVNEDMFKQVAEMTAKQFDVSLSGSLKEIQEETDLKVKNLGSTGGAITIDKPMALGAFFNKPNAVGFGAAMVVNTAGKEQKVAACIALIRVRSRILDLYLYTPYVDETSVQWVRTTGEQWADAVLKANP